MGIMPGDENITTTTRNVQYESESETTSTEDVVQGNTDDNFVNSASFLYGCFPKEQGSSED